MKKWITDHPYFWTSIIFLIIMIIGWQMLYWRVENFAFLLLLYFIVTLGIRLDDISRKIGGGVGNPRVGSGENENLISQLNDIKVSIRALNVTLKKMMEKIEKEEQ
ncbi:hypothetical protein D1BOALGB6SA_6800 [Olavius sp. associated proteobacterium Delta 1]|nr:hypothetical protein D1BOALGB6SA_6800 [Olavius sp. associated proteobacterium Delta 1]